MPEAVEEEEEAAPEPVVPEQWMGHDHNDDRGLRRLGIPCKSNIDTSNTYSYLVLIHTHIYIYYIYIYDYVFSICQETFWPQRGLSEEALRWPAGYEDEVAEW